MGFQVWLNPGLKVLETLTFSFIPWLSENARAGLPAAAQHSLLHYRSLPVCVHSPCLHAALFFTSTLVTSLFTVYYLSPSGESRELGWGH